MKPTVDTLSSLFKALSDGTRLRIVNLLFASGELCVCDIESILGCTQTKISRHMKYLTRAGLTQDRKVGRWVLYSIARPASEDQSIIIRSVREILASHSRTAQDVTLLRENIRKGCCATFTQITPELSRKGNP